MSKLVYNDSQHVMMMIRTPLYSVTQESTLVHEEDNIIPLGDSVLHLVNHFK